jgi:hypothetical protein
MNRIAFVMAPFVVGCIGTTTFDPLQDITVASAELRDVTMWQAAVGAGVADGEAQLFVVDTNGQEIEFDCTLEGLHVGLVADASALVTWGPYPLEVPAGLNARQLLGDYEGPHVGIDVGVGAHYRDLRNDDNVHWNLTAMSLGVGVTPLTWESINVQLDDDPAEEVSVCDDRVVSDGNCDTQCSDDPDCPETCIDDDGVCDAGCTSFFGGNTDSDCDPPDPCERDDFCEASCGDDDPDCSEDTAGPCSADAYDDGVCDEGCQFEDVDCPARLTPPAEWSCDVARYDDGVCDQNCGAVDVGDCAPAEWTCDPSTYDDGVCHCDCGAHDDDCFAEC